VRARGAAPPRGDSAHPLRGRADGARGLRAPLAPVSRALSRLPSKRSSRHEWHDLAALVAVVGSRAPARAGRRRLSLTRYLNRYVFIRIRRRRSPTGRGFDIDVLLPSAEVTRAWSRSSVAGALGVGLSGEGARPPIPAAALASLAYSINLRSWEHIFVSGRSS